MSMPSIALQIRRYRQQIEIADSPCSSQVHDTAPNRMITAIYGRKLGVIDCAQSSVPPLAPLKENRWEQLAKEGNVPQLFGILAQLASRRPHITANIPHIKFRHRSDFPNKTAAAMRSLVHTVRPLDTDGGAGRHDDDAGVYWRYRSLLRRAAGNDSFSSQQHYHSPTMYAKSPTPSSNAKTWTMCRYFEMHVSV
ncbi:hypothetical protein TcasGA2_TC003115 [Tribolium castaneum]|uniref:Uncharacterized protein n=1 Tax=Tribolium castaneum TaxID=7070 RepID=D6WFA7_TRICA|nr:hypothetical protein TcasGA2_TC003115 [Tribolium castaneum]